MLLLLQLCSEWWHVLTFRFRINFRVIWSKYSNIIVWVCFISSQGFPTAAQDTNSIKRWTVQTVTPVTWLLPLSAYARLFFIELKWPADENGNTTQYKIGQMSYKTDYKELNFLCFLKTVTVDDNILPALHRTRFVPASAINWYVSLVLNFVSWTCHRVWRLTYGLTDNRWEHGRNAD
jgi:hypothetical protein